MSKSLFANNLHTYKYRGSCSLGLKVPLLGPWIALNAAENHLASRCNILQSLQHHLCGLKRQLFQHFALIGICLTGKCPLNASADHRLHLIKTENEVYSGDCLKKYEVLMSRKCEMRPEEPELPAKF